MNVLITSAGRRVSLLQAFQEAAHARGSHVLVGDMDALAPAHYRADAAFMLPRVDSPDYPHALLELVDAHQVRVVVPTIDPELGVLASMRNALERLGCHALVSDSDFVRITADKWQTFQMLKESKIATPASWLPEQSSLDELPSDLFLKPRNGSSSKHTHRATTETLSRLLPLVPGAIIQEYVGGLEIAVDALLDLGEGTPLHYVPRRRVKTLAGESIQGVTLSDADLDDWLRDVLRTLGSLGARGPITLQAFLTDAGPVLIEINPRFGGGFPLAFAAGTRYPKWILSMLAGDAVPPRLGTYQSGLYMTRYHLEHFTDTPIAHACPVPQ